MKVKLLGTRAVTTNWRKAAPAITFKPGVEYDIDDDCFDPLLFVSTVPAPQETEEVEEEVEVSPGTKETKKVRRAKKGK